MINQSQKANAWSIFFNIFNHSLLWSCRTENILWWTMHKSCIIIKFTCSSLSMYEPCIVHALQLHEYSNNQTQEWQGQAVSPEIREGYQSKAYWRITLMAPLGSTPSGLHNWGQFTTFTTNRWIAHMTLSFGKELMMAEITSIRQLRTFSVMPSLSLTFLDVNQPCASPEDYDTSMCAGLK